MEINIIAAVGRNLELGKDNQLIWKIKEDLEFFKKMTMGKSIVMGRKTFESLPGLLKGRRHIVLSRTKSVFPSEVIVYKSLKELLEQLKEQEIFVIGGEQIYRLFLEYATNMYLTEIDDTKNADSFFPQFHPDDWDKTILKEVQEPISYKHVYYKKKR